MTSNLTLEPSHAKPHPQSLSSQEREVELKKKLQEYFRPEFLNRIDDIIPFEALKQEHMEQIVDIFLKRVEKMLKAQKIHVIFESSLKKYLAQKGFDPEF